MTDRTVVERVIAELLKPLGFKKTRATWHRASAETVLVLNVQKSGWGPTLYINLGIYLRRLGREATPPEHRCHIRARIESLVEDANPLAEALNLESKLSDAERQRSITYAIGQSALPWLEARETETKARSALFQETEPTGLVIAAARNLLGLKDAAGSRST